jgi:hypothetical protein
MTRIIAAGLATVLAVGLVGCTARENKSPSKLPPASERFDKKLAPHEKGKGAPATPG